MSTTHVPLIIAAAVLTYLTRFAGLALGKRQPPPIARYFLAYIPVAAFAALVSPDLARGGDETAPRIVGAGIAAFIAYRTGKLWVCIVVGMTMYMIVRATGF